MSGKIHLGKTATSRTRKKQVTEAISKPLPVQNGYSDYLLQKGYSQSSVVSFMADVARFTTWMKQEGLEIENIGYNDITSFLRSFGNIGQHTKSCYLRGVRQYFNYLVYLEERTDNPVEFIQVKGAKRKTLYDILNRQQLDKLYHEYSLPEEDSKDSRQNWFKAQVLACKRNKVILGLMLYQGLDTRDLKLLSLADVKLREGKIYIPGTRKSNERLLKLESVQVMDMMEYIYKTREALLALSGRQSDQLLVSVGSSERVANIMIYLLKRLHQINTKVNSVKQLKASVIVHWLKLYNLREVQYMAGHRYVSSTESFLINEMDEMIEDIDKYHPIG